MNKALIGLGAGLFALAATAAPAFACECDTGYSDATYYDYSEYLAIDDFVYADGTVTYTMYLDAGHYTEVSLWGDGASDIDVWVMDPYGYYVGYQGEGTSPYADEYFTFTASVSGYYQVMVENTNKPWGSWFSLYVG